MPPCRLHITGASGAGVTTLGRALASRLGRPHFDSDDFYWQPTNPPYVRARDRAHRVRLMRELFVERPDWIVSGGLDG
jgi:adenylate kinase family enzyme